MLPFLAFGFVQAERKEPVLGAEIIPRLIAPETRSEAFREVQIAKQGENPRQDWRELPMAAFELYHQNILVTECPQLDGAPPLYMVSYLWDYATYSRYYSANRYSRTEGFSPVEDAYKPGALVDPTGRFSSWATSKENPRLSLPPQVKMEERVIVFLTSEGKVIWPFSGDNMSEGDFVAAAGASDHRFKFEADWAGLDPKAAAFAFVDTNQSHVHRNKYTLYYPTNRSQQSLSERVAQLSAAERKAFAAFVRWCQRSIHSSNLNYSNRSYFEWVCETFDHEQKQIFFY